MKKLRLLHAPLSALLTMAALAATSLAQGGVPLAVKRGQTSVDPKTLPFVALGIITAGLRSPIERIVLKDVTRDRTVTARLGKTFDPEHPDYLGALDAQKRIAALVILKLDPGTYEMETIEFTPLRMATTTWLTFDFAKLGHFRFTVAPAAVSFVGSIVVNVPTGQGSIGPGQTRSFAASAAIEATQERDTKWALGQVPGLASLPRTISGIEIVK